MNRRNRQSVLTLILAFITQTVLAIPLNQMQVKIDETIEQHAPNANIGIMVESIVDQKIIYQKNPYQLFVPASIVKILPAVSALSFLGPNYIFQTKILAKKPDIKNGIVNHDLYLYFDGDPSLTQKNLKNLVKQLSTLGIKKITGNIYIDDTVFDREFLGAGWMREDLNLCYASPISAIIVDKNCISIKLAPAKKAGQLATLTNPQKYISITNHVITKNINKNKKRRKLKLETGNENNYTLSGYLRTNTNPFNILIAIHDIRIYLKSWLFHELQTNNIRFRGKIVFKKILVEKNASIYLFAEHRSLPLQKLIATMLKKSDNTIADAIYKKLGQVFYNKKGSWKKGFKAIRNILEAETNSDLSNMYLDDGSGLSRHNQITPNLITETLVYAYNNSRTRQSFINALAHPSTLGTLETRMPNLKNRLYAKTGNMGSVSSLAGYIKTKTQGMVAFTIIFNSFLGNPKKLHKLQDRICTIIANS